MISQQQIMDKLDKIEKEISEIKDHMVDADSIMTEEDYETLFAYREEKKAGQLRSHESLKKELGL
jgi:hypothetical protein